MTRLNTAALAVILGLAASGAQAAQTGQDGWRYDDMDGAYLWYGEPHPEESEFFDPISFTCDRSAGTVSVNAYFDHGLGDGDMAPLSIEVDGRSVQVPASATEEGDYPASLFGDAPAASIPFAAWAQGRAMTVRGGHGEMSLSLAAAAEPIRRFIRACGLRG